MTALFVFAATLLVAVLVSELAERSVLSTAVLFLVTGFVVGEGMLGVVKLTPENPVVSVFAELALFSVLFTDGMKVGFKDLATAWRLPGRALLFGLPLTLLGTALIARWVVGLPWAESFLIGAVLSPTDPVFAAAIVGREEVPARLRQLLNVESGLNDGLALPIVVAMLAIVGKQEFHLMGILWEVVLGIGIGIVVPLVAIKLEQLKFFSAYTTYRPLNAFAIGLLVLTISSLAHGNEFLAAFAAGITVATVGPEVREGVPPLRGTRRRTPQARRPLDLRRLDLAAVLAGDSPAGLPLHDPGAGRRPADRPVALVSGQQARLARVGGGGLVRSQGVRLGRLRPVDPQGSQDGRHRLGSRGWDVPPDRPLHRGVDPRPLLHRRRGRPLAQRRDQGEPPRGRPGNRLRTTRSPRGSSGRRAGGETLRLGPPRFGPNLSAPAAQTRGIFRSACWISGRPCPDEVEPMTCWVRISRVLLLAGLLGGLATPGLRAGESHYVLIFGAQPAPKVVKQSHTWASFVRVVGDGPDPSAYQLFVHTISLVPATLQVRTLALKPEPSANLDLEASLAYAVSKGADTTVWGPFLMRPEVYQRSLEVWSMMMSGVVEYRAIDTLRDSIISDCIHAVTAVDPRYGRGHYPLVRTGKSASRYIARQVVKRVDPDRELPDQTWLIAALGLYRPGVEVILPSEIPIRRSILAPRGD